MILIISEICIIVRFFSLYEKLSLFTLIHPLFMKSRHEYFVLHMRNHGSRGEII